MVVAVVVESAVLVVLAVFVTGLLYSYGDVQRRMEELEATGVPATSTLSSGAVARQDENRSPARSAFDLQGTTPKGDVASVAVVGVAHRTLIAFLSSTCTSCARFWAELGDPQAADLPQGVRLVVVTKGPERESPAEVAAMAGTSPGGIEALMSSQAWLDFEVPGSPYFVLADGPSGSVRGEGTALDWGGVLKLLTLASGDVTLLTGEDDPPAKASADLEREHQIDRALLDAGITPGHSSLYPRPQGQEGSGLL